MSMDSDGDDAMAWIGGGIICFIAFLIAASIAAAFVLG